MQKAFYTILAAVAMLASGAYGATEEDVIRALEERWDTANLKGDAAALETLFSDDFISTDSEGRVRTKAVIVGAVKAKNIKYDSASTEDVKVILHGDAAVVSGIWRGKYTYQGKLVNLVERFTNFYVKQRGQWRCVASHGSALK
jgi:ketosteroid isomerase-like protein